MSLAPVSLKLYLLFWLIPVGWDDKSCMIVKELYWQKDVCNFIAYIAYKEGLFDNFTFLYLTFRLWYDSYILSMAFSGWLFFHFSTWMFHMAYEPVLLVVLYASIAIFFTVYEMCICTYKSQKCLLMQHELPVPPAMIQLQYVVVMFSCLILKK